MAKTLERSAVRPIDLSRAVPRSRNMIDPELMIKWNSYKAKCTSLGGRLLTEAAVECGTGSEHPDLLELHELPENADTEDLKDVIAIPTQVKGASTVRLSWPKKGREATVDLQKLLMLRKFTIPHGQRAKVTITKEQVPGIGPALVFHFSTAKFAPIDPRRSNKNKQSKPEESKEKPVAK